MKLNYLSAILIASTLVFSSCGDDDGGDGPDNTQPTGTLVASRTVFPVTGANSTIDWSLSNAIAVFETSPFGAETLTISASNATTGESIVLTGPFNPLSNVIQNSTTNADLGLATYIRNSTTNAWVSNINAGQLTPAFVVQISSRDTVAKTCTGTFTVRTVNPDSTVQFAFFGNGTFTNLPYIVDDGTPNGNSALTYTVGGTFINSSPVVVVANGNIIFASGSSSDFTKTVSLQLLSTAGPGTYEITEIGGEFSGTYSVSSQSSPSSVIYQSTGGTLTITAHDMILDRIRGTFSFNADTQSLPTQTVVLTNGTFDIYY